MSAALQPAASKIAADPRIDPRIKALFGWPDRPPVGDIASREALIEEANSPAALAGEQAMEMMLGACNSEENAPSTGLTITTETFVSAPDGNTIRVQFIRPAKSMSQIGG